MPLSVTRILAAAGIVDTQWFTEHARVRGSHVHLATQYLDEGTLDESTIKDDSVKRRVDQYRRFLDDVQPRILAIEEEVTHPTLQYVGHLDRRVEIAGREGVLDLKPAPQFWHGLQLAGYTECFDRPLARWALYVTETTYKLVPKTDRDDRRIFLAAYHVAAFKRRHKQ